MYDFNICNLWGIFCFIDSFSPHTGKSFIHATDEKAEIIKIMILPIVTIHDKIQFIKNMFTQAVIKTITRKIKFTHQILIYHDTKLFSTSVRDKFEFILLFTNGAKNITHAIAESFASDEMMFFSTSIIKHNIKL